MKTINALATNWLEYVRSRLPAKQPLIISLNSVSEITLWKAVLGNLLIMEKSPLRWNFVPIPDFAIMSESVEDVRQVTFAAGIYSPWQYFFHLLRAAQSQSEESVVSCAMSLQQMLGEIEEQVGFLEWGEIRKGIQHLAASTSTPLFNRLITVCDRILTQTLERSIGDELPPHIIFLIPAKLLSFAEQGQPVGIGVDAWENPKKVGQHLKIAAHYAGQHCYHEIADGEQTKHNLEFAVLVRRSHCEPVAMCWCEPVAKPGTHDWFVHNSVEPRGQKPGQHTSPLITPPGPGSLAEAALRATIDGDLSRVDSVLRHIPKRGSWRDFILGETITAGRIVLGANGDRELIGWGHLSHAKTIMESVIDTIVRHWRIPGAELLATLASAGLLEMAVYCAGYLPDGPQWKIQIHKAAKAARKRGHARTAEALAQLRRPASP